MAVFMYDPFWLFAIKLHTTRLIRRHGHNLNRILYKEHQDKKDHQQLSEIRTEKKHIKFVYNGSV